MTNESEVWKDIYYESVGVLYDFTGWYQASNLGRVKSVERVVVYKDGHKHFYKEKILKPKLRNDGYVTICLCKNSKEYNPYLHRVIATSFLPNEEKKECINHKDGNKSNNAVLNLEWATYSENNLHAHATGLNIPRIGQDSHGAKLTNVDVLEIRTAYSKGDISQNKLGEKYGVSSSNICMIVKRKQWSHI